MGPCNRVRVWRPTASAGLLLLRATYERQSFERHTHADYVLGVNVAGAHRFACRGKVHEVPPGTLALVNPEEVHTGEVWGDASWDYCGFYVDPTWLARIWADLSGRVATPELLCGSHVAPDLAMEFVRLHARLANDDDSLATSSAIASAFAHLLERFVATGTDATRKVRPKRRDKDVASVHAYLHAHYQRPVTIGELAALVETGEFALMHRFREVYGISPYACLLNIRIQHATALLSRGMSVAAAAHEVGFCDQSHLTRHFKRVMGVTPGRFRASTAARVTAQ